MSKLRDFSQFPNILFDMDLLPEDSYLVGFLRFWRHYATRKETFRGSYRRLANIIRMPKSCVARMVPEWEQAGFVTKEIKTKPGEKREEMVLTINVEAFWEFNYAYYPERPKLGQQNIIVPSDIPSESNSVPNWDSTVPSRDNSVPDWDNSVPRASSNSDVILGNTTVILNGNSKDTYGASIDSAALTQLQNENASLKARLEQLLSEIKNARNPGGNDTPSDTPFTPAGGNDQLPDAREMITSDHTAIPEPVVSPTMPLTESQGIVALPDQDKPPVGEYSASESTSSTQAVKDLSNQATEQGKQASGDDPIATKATNNQPAQDPPATKKPRGGKSSGKKATEINEVMQKRVEKVYEYFDKLKQEVMQKPDARYRRTGTDTEAIIAWLDSHPTEEILREVYLRLWNTPVDKRTNFSWKKNMWIHSVLKQYETMEMDIVDERNRQAKRNVVTPGVKSTFVPPVEEEDEMAFVLPSQLRKRG